MVAAGARITSFGNAVAAGDITGWPLIRFTPLGAAIRPPLIEWNASSAG